MPVSHELHLRCIEGEALALDYNGYGLFPAVRGYSPLHGEMSPSATKGAGTSKVMSAVPTKGTALVKGPALHIGEANISYTKCISSCIARFHLPQADFIKKRRLSRLF